MAVLTLDDFPIEEIRQEAAKMRFGDTVLSLIGWVIYHLGYAVTLLFAKVIWGSVRFTVASFKAGSIAAKGPSKRMVIEAQQRQIRDMQMQLSRFTG